MLSAILRIIHLGAQLAFYRARLALPAVFTTMRTAFTPAIVADMRAARRLERIATRLAGMRVKIGSLASRLNDGSVTERIDADHSFRDSLIGLKEEIRDVRCLLAQMQESCRYGSSLWPPLHRAFEHLTLVARETYSAADQLLWDIDSHEARFA